MLRFDSPLLFTNVERFRKIVENVAADWDGLKCCGKLERRQFVIGEQNEVIKSGASSSISLFASLSSTSLSTVCRGRCLTAPFTEGHSEREFRKSEEVSHH